MGMHAGLIAAKTSSDRLRAEFFPTWPQWELVTSADNLPDEAALEAWKQSHQEFVSAADWSKDRPGKEVFAFWQDGPWAILADRSYVLASDEDALKALSDRFGTVLSFVVETAGGWAEFCCYENGSQRRKISNIDGEAEISGEPLPEEAGIDINQYYMQETEDLWRAFGLAPLYDGAPPAGGYHAICVADRTDYSDLLKTSGDSPSQKTSTPPLITPSPPRERQKPWWRFW